MSVHKKAALVSEAGWKGLRELSLELARGGLLVDVMIKGSVKKEVLDVISRPPGVRIYAIPRRAFKVYLFFYFLWHKALGDLTDVVVSKAQTGSWARGFGFDAKLLIETEGGYRLEQG